MASSVSEMADSMVMMSSMVSAWGKERLEPLQLGLLGDQAALRVVVGLADVIAVLLLVGDVAQLPHLGQQVLEPLRRHPGGVVRGAVAAVVVDRRPLEVAAHLLHQPLQTGDGVLEGGGLHLHMAGVDHLGVGQPVLPAGRPPPPPGPPGTPPARRPSCRRRRPRRWTPSSSPAAASPGSVVSPAAAAAGEQRQHQQQRQDPCVSSSHAKPSFSSCPLIRFQAALSGPLYPYRRKRWEKVARPPRIFSALPSAPMIPYRHSWNGSLCRFFGCPDEGGKKDVEIPGYRSRSASIIPYAGPAADNFSPAVAFFLFLGYNVPVEILPGRGPGKFFGGEYI